MAGKPAGEKTEQATPQKKKKARKDGQIAHSPELGSWLSLAAASFVIPMVCSSLMSLCRATMVQVGALITTPDTSRALQLARDTMLEAAMATVPLAAVVMLTSVLASGSQAGIYLAPKLWKPKVSRLNPFSGVKRMFGPQGLWQLVKSMLKLGVLCGITYLSVRDLVPALMSAGTLPLTSVLDTTVDSAMRLVRYGAVAGVVMAIADVIVVRRRTSKQLKMTKQEVKQEHKTSEGDPVQKGARRSRALAMSRNRMMADLPTADVIVLNPTHLAVALRYDPARGAPRVIAKGADFTAARIREVAAEHRIPMVRDVALARSLHATCEIGHEIPADLYQGVATVLAFVMRLRRRGSVAGTHQLPAVAH
ncbi:EscU/YscU/HrcU family type III secretion system export apparatus switch protein [Rhodococcus sp. X156]|uniref:EscU/YscU/HrcU family type III secretion system export apparatus switch protein n=1 Tax=Rhodococcus sp. X156 TaxID=2499145 RepID=UPI000FD9387F|nr:EscU/YscU/HrcU family type III secretion system export apparatus switch protein [Rhodococcus sp. X156]